MSGADGELVFGLRYCAAAQLAAQLAARRAHTGRAGKRRRCSQSQALPSDLSVDGTSEKMRPSRDSSRKVTVVPPGAIAIARCLRYCLCCVSQAHLLFCDKNGPLYEETRFRPPQKMGPIGCLGGGELQAAGSCSWLQAV